jgi:hypothetical protein
MAPIMLTVAACTVAGGVGIVAVPLGLGALGFAATGPVAGKLNINQY